MKTSQRPSGGNPGSPAPSVPGTSSKPGWSAARTNSLDTPSFGAVSAICDPSGEIARWLLLPRGTLKSVFASGKRKETAGVGSDPTSAPRSTPQMATRTTAASAAMERTSASQAPNSRDIVSGTAVTSSSVAAALRPRVRYLNFSSPSAALNSAAPPRRSAGSFSSVRLRAASTWAGTVWRAAVMDGASVVRILARMACAVDPEQRRLA